jgi:hypothetical protein
MPKSANQASSAKPSISRKPCQLMRRQIEYRGLGFVKSLFRYRTSGEASKRTSGHF